MGDGRVGIGISNSKRSIGALNWILENNLVAAGDEILLIHVKHPIRYVPTPVGNLAVSQLSEQKVAEYAKVVQDKIDAFVEAFKKQCQLHQIKPTYVQVENDCVHKALVNQITPLGITKLVLGSSGRTGLKRKLSGPGIGAYVASRAPESCSVLVVAKNKLVTFREFDECQSLSSVSTRTSDSEAPEVPNVSSSSSSSQGEGDVRLPPRLHGLPEGLGRRWSFLSRLLSGSERKPIPVPATLADATPLNEIEGARMFVSPFVENLESVSLENRPTAGTMALLNHKLGGSSGSRSWSSSSSGGGMNGALSKMRRRSESCASSGARSSLDSEPDEARQPKPSLEVEVSRLEVSSQSSLETDSVEAPFPPPPRRRKTLRELAQLSERTFTEYEFSELETATNNFSESVKLGEGGYGLVYRGKLCGRDVAIKVLKKEGCQRSSEFQHEVELLGRIKHPHMVVLLGCCSYRGCLVYEFMANGSLEDRLFCRNKTPPLPWYSRFRIAAEVASALHFLHNLGPEPVVHRDLKPANILLDHNNISKVGDVGLAKLVPERLAAISSTYFRDTNPVGTFAYIDPEYQRTGSFGPKSDVYALGIVILQLLTGRPPVGVHAVVEEAIECGKLSSVLDESAGEWPLGKAEEVACLALQCGEMKRRQRPSLETVLPILQAARNYAENCAAISATNKALSGDAGAPSIFLCPIFQEVMQEPVVAADGNTYEYEAIREWFQGHDTSPMTNLKLEHKQLTPHHALNKLITEWKARNNKMVDSM